MYMIINDLSNGKTDKQKDIYGTTEFKQFAKDMAKVRDIINKAERSVYQKEEVESKEHSRQTNLTMENSVLWACSRFGK